MVMPRRTDPQWRTLVEHPEKFAYTFLALKIMMQRVARKNAAALPVAEREALTDEVFAFFEKNQKLVGQDIAAIFG